MENRKYKTALLVIDMQNDFTKPDGRVFYQSTGEMMPRLCENINIMRDKGVLIVVVYTVHSEKRNLNPELTSMRKAPMTRGTGGELLDERIPYHPETDILWEKFAASAFFKTNLDEVLRENGVENVLVCGVKTNVCCRATATDAASYGYMTYMVSDMIATNTKELSEFHLAEMTKYFAKALDSQEVLRRLDEGRL